MGTRSLRAGLLAALILLVMAPAALAASPPSLSVLQPGGFRTISQDLTVNVVFVGYEKGTGARDIDEGAFTAILPDGYSTISRYPALYGLKAGLGLDFAYDYNLVYADSSFEDAFFGYLKNIAVSKPLTAYQADYNATGGRLAGRHRHCWIDAPSVEKWLRRPRRGDRHGHHQVHHLLHRLVRASGLQLPRLHQDRRARPGHRLQLRRSTATPAR